jgi:hypothetical protein
MRQRQVVGVSEDLYDRLANAVRPHLDLTAIYRILGV